MTQLQETGIRLGSSAVSDDEYIVKKSIRCDKGSGGHFEREWGRNGDNSCWTWSAWIKRTNIGLEYSCIFGAEYGDNGQNWDGLYFDGSERLEWRRRWGNGVKHILRTTQQFRDCSGWFHVCLVMEAHAEENETHERMYINGKRIIGATVSQRSASSKNQSGNINNSGRLHYIGSGSSQSDPEGKAMKQGDIKIADVHFLDSMAIGPCAFAEYDANGNWVPKAFKLPAPNAGQVWSNSVTGTAYSASYDAAKAFNGSFENVCHSENGGEMVFSYGNKANTLEIAFDNGSATDGPGSGYLKINDIDVTHDLPLNPSGGSSIVADIDLQKYGISTISTIKWKRHADDDFVSIRNIRVDGVWLIDGKVDPTEFNNQNWKQYPGKEWRDMITGNGSSKEKAVNKNSDEYLEGSADGSTHTFTPDATTPLGGQLRVRGYSTNAAYNIVVNGSDTGKDLPTSYTDRDWVNVGNYSSITSISFTSTGTGKLFLGNIDLDGVRLLSDTTDHSYHLKMEDVTSDWQPGKDYFGGKIADYTGALPIYNTEGATALDTDYGDKKGSGYRTDSNSSSLVFALVGDATDDKSKDINTNSDDKGAATVSGAVVSSNSSKFYNSSIFFDGSNDNLNWGLTSLGTDDMDFGSGDWCLEGWVNILSINGHGPLVSKWHGTTSNTYDWRIYCDATKIYADFCFGGTDHGGLTDLGNIELAALTNENNEWFHWAITRDGNTCRTFINGRIRKTVTVSGALDDDNGSLTFGFANIATNNRYLHGYQQDFRAYKGAAKYTQDFVIPVRNSWVPKNIHVTTGSKEVPLSTDDVSITRTGGNHTSTGTVEDVYDGNTSTGIRDYSEDQSELLQELHFPNGFGSAASDGAYYLYTNGSDNCNGTGRCGWATTNNSYGGSGWRKFDDGTGWLTWSNQGYGGTPWSITKKGASSNASSWGNNTFVRGFRMGTDAANVWIIGKYPMFTKTLTARHMDTSSDSPSNYEDATGDTGVGGQIVGNYCQFDPTNTTTNTAIAEGCLQIKAEGSNQWKIAVANMGVTSGKWYWEYEIIKNGDHQAGLVSSGHQGNINNVDSLALADQPFGWSYNGNSGKAEHNGSESTYGNTYTTGDVIGVAFDATNGKLWFAKNNTWQNSGDPAAAANPAFTGITGATAYYPAWGGYTNNHVIYNFGASPFKYTAPTNFKCLCSQNLGTLAIDQPELHFDAKKYIGTGASGNVVKGFSFQPDLLITKTRAGTHHSGVINAIRGKTKFTHTSALNAEGTDADMLTSFNADGFTWGDDKNITNESGDTYIAFAWDGGTTQGNTDGSTDISSPLQYANSTAGFSMTQYTGNNAARTIGHGLGVKPEMIITKALSGGSDANTAWRVWHTGLSGMSKRLEWNDDGVEATSATSWNNTAPTASVFSLGADGNTNQDSAEYLCLCWTSVKGFSRFGKFEGNGNADGPVIELGFKPRMLMLKNIDTADKSWVVVDSERNLSSPLGEAWFPDLDNTACSDVTAIDFYANGFKIKGTDTKFNSNDATIVYAAWADKPFKYSRTGN